MAAISGVGLAGPGYINPCKNCPGKAKSTKPELLCHTEFGTGMCGAWLNGCFKSLNTPTPITKTTSQTINKPFLLFAYSDYYPTGGINDLIKNFSSEKELNNYVTEETKRGRMSYENVDTVDVRKYINFNYEKKDD